MQANCLPETYYWIWCWTCYPLQTNKKRNTVYFNFLLPCKDAFLKSSQFIISLQKSYYIFPEC